MCCYVTVTLPVVTCVQVDCVSVCADTPAASEVKLASVFQRADALQPCVLLLRNLQLLLRPRGGAEEDGRVQAAFCQLLHSAPTRSLTASNPHTVTLIGCRWEERVNQFLGSWWSKVCGHHCPTCVGPHFVLGPFSLCVCNFILFLRHKE